MKFLEDAKEVLNRQGGIGVEAIRTLALGIIIN